MSLVMGMRNKSANDGTFIRETQSALKTLSAMSPISSATINYAGSYDTSATRIKSHKKYRPNEPKYPTHDFNDFVDSNGCDKTASYAMKEQKCDAYEQMADYRMSATVSSNAQNSSSAFRPPFNDGKRGNTFAAPTTMPYAAYHFGDTGGYANYSHDMATTAAATTTAATTERDKPHFDKPYAPTKDDDLHVSDPKEYTTLQPAKVGSKADSVIQEVVARDGFAMAGGAGEATGMSANPQPTTMASGDRAAFYEAPGTATLAAFSPGSTNKGKYERMATGRTGMGALLIFVRRFFGCRRTTWNTTTVFECLIDSITLCAYTIKSVGWLVLHVPDQMERNCV